MSITELFYNTLSFPAMKDDYESNFVSDYESNSKFSTQETKRKCIKTFILQIYSL